MDRSAFTLLHEMEDSWWYRGRAAVVRSVLGRPVSTQGKRVLDFGAGHGGMKETLAPYGAVSAFEPDAQARAVAATRGYDAVHNDMDAALSRTYDLVGLFDVVEHIEDDHAFLRQLRASLAPNARIAVTVPAMPFLWSAHDVTHHHFRRYTRSSLRALLESEGYAVRFISYWNTFLFPLAALARTLGKGGQGSLRLPRGIDALVTWLVQFEAKIMRFIPLPFGVSLVAIAELQGAASRRVSSRLMFLMRYGISGAVGGLTQTFVLWVWISVLGLAHAYMLGLVLGFLLALGASFVLQKFWAFKDQEQRRTPRQLAMYAAVALSGLGLNALLLALSKELFEAVSVDFFEGWYVLAQLVIVGIVSLSNFCLNFLFTFREARRAGTWKR